MNLAATSLVAAIPAGFLAFLLGTSAIPNMGEMPTVLMASSIALLVVVGLVLLLPIWLLIESFRSKSKQPAVVAAAAGGAAETSAVPSANEEVSSDSFADESEAGFDLDDDDFESNDEFEFDEDEDF